MIFCIHKITMKTKKTYKKSPFVILHILPVQLSTILHKVDFDDTPQAM